MEIKVICVDMFQTLVDVNTRIPFIWGSILSDKYDEESAYKYGTELQSCFIKRFYSKSKSEEFETIESMFADSFDNVFRKYGLNFSAKKAAEIIIKEHGFSEPYNDTDLFFNLVADFPLCLVSDADLNMINPILERYKFDEIFLSEQLGTYKSSPGNIIFKKVLDKYTVKPKEVLHIGDCYSDIYGANQIGIQTCWINRNNREWDKDIKPDYIIHSLKEIEKIICIRD